ncbi:MAG: hypothetical protein LIO69_03055 [Oscillospiraceae bacterium]|nr:hypothetical protein [Oscillospiraceae bacterium]
MNKAKIIWLSTVIPIWLLLIVRQIAPDLKTSPYTTAALVILAFINVISYKIYGDRKKEKHMRERISLQLKQPEHIPEYENVEYKTLDI